MNSPTRQWADAVFRPKSLMVSSGDLDEVVEGCSEALRPHRLMLCERKAALSTRLHHLPVGPFSLNRLQYGADVVVAPAVPEEDNFLVTLPLQGKARFAHGSDETSVSPGHGAVVGPYCHFRFDIGATFDQIIIRLDRHRVETICCGLVGSDKLQPVHFSLQLAEMPSFWLPLLEVAAGLPEAGDQLAYQRLFIQAEEMIVSSMLLTLPHNHTSSINLMNRHTPRSQVRRAMQYMREHIEEPIRFVDVAKHVGSSLRGLQLGFQRDLGASPSRWLRMERLDRVHSILSNAYPGSVSVTKVAMQMGFLHLGEFAAQYKKRFGRRPSDVLAKKQ